MYTTPYKVASKFIGMEEVQGTVDNPQIVAMLKLDQDWPEHDEVHDEVPWCSAFMNYICWLLDLPRTEDLLARSWLNVGREVQLDAATIGNDIVILKRGGGDQPGPLVMNAPGHVGFFAGRKSPGAIQVLGGNQSNTVKVSTYPASRILGIRRIL